MVFGFYHYSYIINYISGKLANLIQRLEIIWTVMKITHIFVYTSFCLTNNNTFDWLYSQIHY